MIHKNSKLVSLIFLTLFIALVAFATDAIAGGGDGKGISSEEEALKYQINRNIINSFTNPNR